MTRWLLLCQVGRNGEEGDSGKQEVAGRASCVQVSVSGCLLHWLLARRDLGSCLRHTWLFFHAVTGSTLLLGKLLGKQVPSLRLPMHACCLGSWRFAVPSAVIGQVVHVSRCNTNLETVAGMRSITAATLALQRPSISSAEWTVYHERIMAACAR